MTREMKSIAMIFSTLLLASCATITPAPSSNTTTATPAPATKPVLSTLIRIQTATITPGSGSAAQQTPTAQETAPLPASTATPTLPGATVLEGLRMLYVYEGNLYHQDDSAPSRQLTDNGEDSYPTLSDDGKKVVFFRGLIPRDLYVINVDEGQEQALVTHEVLLALGYGDATELRSFAFLPGSHQLLFNTHELDPLDVKNKDQNRRGAQANDDLLIVDSDTGEVRPLLPPGKGGNFRISPDGNLVAVQAQGHVDVVDVAGGMIRRNLVTYTPSQPVALEPYIYWLPDSAGLLVLLPTMSKYDLTGPASYAAWRYPLNGDAAVQIALDPPLTDAGPISISPDRNWLLYNPLVEGAMASLNLADLLQGRSQAYAPPSAAQGWSPDSRHFVYDLIGQGLFLGSVGDAPISIARGTFLGWIDADRYLYFEKDNPLIWMGETDGEAVALSHDVPVSALRNGRKSFTFIFLAR